MTWQDFEKLLLKYTRAAIDHDNALWDFAHEGSPDTEAVAQKAAEECNSAKAEVMAAWENQS